MKRVNVIVQVQALFLHVLSVLLTFGLENQGQEISIHEHANFGGASQNLTISTCVSSSSFKENVRGSISSVRLRHDNHSCVHIYKAQGCQGYYVKLTSKTPRHDNLAYYDGFNDQIQSIGPCHNDSCHPDYVEHKNETVVVEMYSNVEYQGRLWKITVPPRRCVATPVGSKFMINSVLVKATACIELFQGVECPSFGPSMEISPGVPSTTFPWTGIAHGIKSLAFCGLNCPGVKGEKTIIKVTTAVFEGFNETIPHVTIYEEPNFHGNRRHLRIDRGCVNVSGDWEGQATSINNSGHCVVLYKYPNCEIDGNTSLNQPWFHRLDRIETNLKNIGFFGKVRSIDSCDSNGGISNRIGRKSRDGEVNNIKNGGSDLVIAVVIVFVIGFIIMLLSVTLLVWMRRKQKYSISSPPLTEKDVEDFFNGGEEEDPLTPGSSLPYDRDRLEVLRIHVKIDRRKLLGHGTFGKVYAGRVASFSDVSVAVKCVSSTSGVDFVKSALKEIKMMAYVGEHKHIVKLVGCCTQNIQHEFLILTDLCVNGSLLNLLQNHRSVFVNFTWKGLIYERNGINVNVEPTMMETPSHFYFDTFHLMDWAYQIADGMDFISSKRVVHGDIAARNCLLDANFEVKIGDFGLSKRLYQYTKYVGREGTPLPWKSLSLEVLERIEFSTHSDVWAYGITLHEIFSLGAEPYPGMTLGSEFIAGLKEGLRPSKSPMCPSDCYNLMLECWRETPQERITFSELKERLGDFLQTQGVIRDQLRRKISTECNSSSIPLVSTFQDSRAQEGQNTTVEYCELSVLSHR